MQVEASDASHIPATGACLCTHCDLRTRSDLPVSHGEATVCTLNEKYLLPAPSTSEAIEPLLQTTNLYVHACTWKSPAALHSLAPPQGDKEIAGRSRSEMTEVKLTEPQAGSLTAEAQSSVSMALPAFRPIECPPCVLSNSSG